jgi:hypothetical protein
MPTKRTPADTLRKAREKGSGQAAGIVDGKRHFKNLEPGTERNYQNKLDLWNEYVSYTR